jgi:hypothetical protein
MPSLKNSAAAPGLPEMCDAKPPVFVNTPKSVNCQIWLMPSLKYIVPFALPVIVSANPDVWWKLPPPSRRQI